MVCDYEKGGHIMSGTVFSSRLLMVISLLYAAIIACPAWAHNPIVVNGGPTDAATAHKIADIAVSRVAYHHAEPGQATLWLVFDGKAGERFDFQMGLPKLDRYAETRPATAILGPGLPEPPSLPFTVPEGLGAQVYRTEGESPTLFNEEFTGTTDWQFRQESITLPQDGTYYAVTYVPSGAEAKLWIATGTEEVFGIWDIIRLPAVIITVRLFHEIFPWGGILGWSYLAVLALSIAGLAGLLRP